MSCRDFQMADIQKGQKQPTSHSCTELNKTEFFPVSIVNAGKISTEQSMI